MRGKLRPFILFFLIILVTLIGIEGLLRFFSHANEDGQVYLAGRPLFPYRLPLAATRAAIAQYLDRADEAYIVPSPGLGWTLAPNASGQGGLYQTNSVGIRSKPREFSAVPDPGVLRIGLFGDSFTHGDEEPWEKSWAKFLEDELARMGVRAEVLNFGVPGYGLDQAFLRWRQEGSKWNLQVAVLGFQPENLNRVVNIYRQLYSPGSGMVFSKPRFILAQDGGLEVVNLPVPAPELIPQLLSKLPESELAVYEYWFRPDYYRDFPGSQIRLISLIHTLWVAGTKGLTRDNDHGPGIVPTCSGSEAFELARRILDRFSVSAAEAGVIPIILHIPDKSSLKKISSTCFPDYLALLKEADAVHGNVVDPAPEMAGKHKLYKYAHLSSRGGRLVARSLARKLSGMFSTPSDGLRISKDDS